MPTETDVQNLFSVDVDRVNEFVFHGMSFSPAPGSNC